MVTRHWQEHKVCRDSTYPLTNSPRAYAIAYWMSCPSLMSFCHNLYYQKWHVLVCSKVMEDGFNVSFISYLVSHLCTWGFIQKAKNPREGLGCIASHLLKMILTLIHPWWDLLWMGQNQITAGSPLYPNWWVGLFMGWAEAYSSLAWL